MFVDQVRNKSIFTKRIERKVLLSILTQHFPAPWSRSNLFFVFVDHVTSTKAIIHEKAREENLIICIFTLFTLTFPYSIEAYWYISIILLGTIKQLRTYIPSLQTTNKSNRLSPTKKKGSKREFDRPYTIEAHLSSCYSTQHNQTTAWISSLHSSD